MGRRAKGKQAVETIPRETATVERLLHAPIAEEVLETAPGHTAALVIKITDAPLELLYVTGSLGKRDSHDALSRRSVARRLYEHWYHSNMSPMGTRDYRKPYSGGGDAFAIMPMSERQAMHRMHFRRAMEALGPGRIGQAVVCIVIEEQRPAETGKSMTGRNDKTACSAVAIEFLCEGLDRLRELWGAS